MSDIEKEILEVLNQNIPNEAKAFLCKEIAKAWIIKSNEKCNGYYTDTEYVNGMGISEFFESEGI
jgi:hypothetical protein